MRKSQQKQIQDMLAMLDKAHDAVKKAIETGNREIAFTLLEQCQDSAIQIGGLIEESLGEDFVTVGMLESYCEQIFQTYEAIRQQRPLNINKMCKNLHKELIQIENSVKNDIRVRMTVVFLPYKASMWDSLESVWKAADEDPDCDAYVIPIPYFDKNPDGSFKEEHYEGDQYPAYVPITRYDEYDLVANRPDVICIHNPYDEHNHVTSVHPYFYCKNLRNYTDTLVYIPYFILRTTNPDDQKSIDGMKHFCFTPGTIYAHKVIVQSENMRRIYINEYRKAAKEMGLSGEHVDRKFLEEKFLGTGSPKLDKVSNIKREDLEIPEEWLRIIEKPDESWKRIVLYNTSVSALLQHEDAMLRKMEYVFRIFKENTEDVVLLWRPHPLIQGTIESMRPQLWEDYKRIKDRYIEEGWGIYDDTADLNRAIGISDGYYGDPSSVVQLCQKAEVPCVIQAVRLDEDSLQNNKIELVLDNVVYCDKKIWFCPHKFNGLFSMDIVTREVKCLGDFPNTAYCDSQQYISWEMIGKRIYFIPCFADAIAVYNIEDDRFDNVIKLDEKKIDCKFGDPLFAGCAKYKHFLFLLPIRSRAIVRLNIENNELDYITEWADQAEQITFNKEGSFFRKQSIVKDDILWCPFGNANAILELDCNTLQTTIHTLGKEERGYSGICYDGQSFWMSSRSSGDVIQWNPTTNKEFVVKGFRNRDAEKQNLYTYAGILYYNSEITVFPAVEEEIVIKNEKDKIIIADGAYSCVKEDGGLLFYQNRSGQLTIIDKNSGNKTEVPIMADLQDIDIRPFFVAKDYYWAEQDGIHVNDLITMQRFNKEDKEERQNDTSNGEKIYKILL